MMSIPMSLFHTTDSPLGTPFSFDSSYPMLATFSYEFPI